MNSIKMYKIESRNPMYQSVSWSLEDISKEEPDIVSTEVEIELPDEFHIGTTKGGEKALFRGGDTIAAEICGSTHPILVTAAGCFHCRKISILEELKEQNAEIKELGIMTGYVSTEKGARQINLSDSQDIKEGTLIRYLSVNGLTVPSGKTKLFSAKGTEYEGKDKILSYQEAERLAAEGKIFSFTGRDLYREYYQMERDPELLCFLENRYSTKSRDYIKACEDKIGLTSYYSCLGGREEEEENQIDNNIQTYQISAAPQAPTAVTHMLDGSWRAITEWQCAPDDYVSVEMYFTDKPDRDAVLQAFAIELFERKMYLGQISEIFYCTTCKRLVHWTELEGDICTKLYQAEQHDCCHPGKYPITMFL